jgi:hypothetical protein
MATPQQLGSFNLTSPKVVITDPTYDTETASIGSLGCFLSPCATGTWRVEVIEDVSPNYGWPMPRIFMAILDSLTLSGSEVWDRSEDAVGGDTGIIGIFDVAHFHDTNIIPPGQEWTFEGRPAVPEKLWYSYICEVLQKRESAVIPYGAVVNWDGGIDVDVIRHGHRIVAIRLSIYGWPNQV